MKKLVVISLLLASQYARADLVVVEQSLESRQQPKTITIQTKDDKYRIDYGDKLSVIYNLATGDSIRVDHSAATYTTLSGSQAVAMKNSMQKAGIVPTGKPPRIVDTGKTEKINGYNAEVYTAETPSATYTFWVTKDYPNFDVVRQEMKKVQAASDALDQPGFLSLDLSKLDGLVIKSERLTGGGELMTLTLQSATIQPVADAEFQPPVGYKDISLPAAATPQR